MEEKNKGEEERTDGMEGEMLESREKWRNLKNQIGLLTKILNINVQNISKTIRFDCFQVSMCLFLGRLVNGH